MCCMLTIEAHQAPSDPGLLQVRAMQIIDELETVKRGPYGGGVGVVAFSGAMDMALALRTMVIPTAAGDCLYDYKGSGRREWLVNLQVCLSLTSIAAGTLSSWGMPV